jgi:hypothetical protein
MPDEVVCSGVRVNDLIPQLLPSLGAQSLELSTHEQRQLFTNTGQIAVTGKRAGKDVRPNVSNEDCANFSMLHADVKVRTAFCIPSPFAHLRGAGGRVLIAGSEGSVQCEFGVQGVEFHLLPISRFLSRESSVDTYTHPTTVQDSS